MPVGAHIRVTSSGLDKIAAGFGATEKAVKRMGGTALVVTEKLQHSLGGVTSKLSGLYGAIGGVGLVAGAKRVTDYNRVLAQLKVDAGMTETEVRGLNAGIAKMSTTSGIAADEILSAYRVFMDFGGQVDFAKDVMGDLLTFSQATGTAMDDAANIAATLSGNLKLGKEEVVEALSTMNELGKAGQMSLKDVASNMAQILASGTSKRFTGMRGVRQLGAAHQIIAKSYGTGPEAAATSRTALDALLSDLTTREKKLKNKFGVNVFNKDRSMRDLDAIMGEVLRKTKGDAAKLAKIFTRDSLKAVAAFADTNDPSKLGGDVSKLFSVTGSREQLVEAAREVTTGIGGAAHKMDVAAAKLRAALQEHGTGLIERVAADPAKAAMLVGGGLLAAKTVFPFVKSLLGMRGGWGGLLGGGPGGGIGGAGGAAGNLLGVQKVFVVNLSGSGLGSAAGALGGAAGGAAGSLGKFGAAVEVAKGALVAFSLGFGLGTILDEWTGASDKISKWLWEVNNPKEARRRGAYRVQQMEARAEAIKQEKAEGVINDVNARKFVGPLRPDELAPTARRPGEFWMTSANSAAGRAEASGRQVVEVIVKPAGGIDRVDVDVGRGRLK